MIDFLILTLIALCIALAVRSVYRSQKRGAGCSGCANECVCNEKRKCGEQKNLKKEKPREAEK